MGEKDTIKGVWLAALAIIVKYPLATLVPAAVLGALGEASDYLIESRPVVEQVLTAATSIVAYYLYLAYAEGIVEKAEQETGRLGWRDALRELRLAAPLVPRVFVAALIAVLITSAATILLIIPGVWLYTRWSLTTPVIRQENLGAIAALRRSNELVRGHFWFVCLTATVAFYLEEVVIHLGAEVAWSLTESHTWGEWVGGSLVATLVVPLAAFATSLAHSSVARRQ